MKVTLGTGSNLYALIKVMPITYGDVLECGTGLYSTPFLHWSCYGKRHLVSYESVPKYFDMSHGYISENHEMFLVDDWDKADIEKPWDVALVDHAPNERRVTEVIRLAPFVKFLVLHDTEPKREIAYHYAEGYAMYKFRVDFPIARTHVSILSNFVDVKRLFG